MPAPDPADTLILCVSQPSLSAREAARILAALRHEAERRHRGPVAVIRLEGGGPGLCDALRVARDSGAARVRVQPVGFPMAANILAWLPGAVAHFAASEAGAMAIELAGPPGLEEAAAALVAPALGSAPCDLAAVAPTLGKPGWQFLPAHDTHILVCTGPRCAFRGAGTLQARLKERLAQKGLAARCLVSTTGCLFPCNQGPMIALYPRNLWFRIPDEAALERVLEEVIARGGDAADLRLAARPDSSRAPTPFHDERTSA